MVSAPCHLRRAGVLATMLLLVARVPDAAAHPIHTSLAQLTHDAARREITVSLRVYADDFSAAVARAGRVQTASIAPGGPASDSAMARYLAARFTLVERSGAPVRLAWCGVRAAGEVLFVCLRAPSAAPLTGATLRNTVLMEKFDDQVNIVQTMTAVGAVRRTTLFTRGSETKRLP